jgi:hypothetical protein
VILIKRNYKVISFDGFLLVRKTDDVWRVEYYERGEKGGIFIFGGSEADCVQILERFWNSVHTASNRGDSVIQIDLDNIIYYLDVVADDDEAEEVRP